MVHVLAVVALGLLCVVWAWVQLASDSERGGACGACGLGGGADCARDRDVRKPAVDSRVE
ncbi:MAG: hypothetical protein GY719_32240 [bacterium]|nr:hypothetical protein [bacterium]